MSERVHMVAPDGRTFTLKEWGDYLREHEYDSSAPYVGLDGKVFEVDGFQFNVHGVCINPHSFRIAPEGERIAGILTYVDVRTYRGWISREDRRVVWWCSFFAMNCSCHAYGHLDPDDPDEEREIIIRGLRQGRASMMRQIEWYNLVLRCDDGDVPDSGYSTSRYRCQRMLRLVEAELENYMQLSLFDL